MTRGLPITMALLSQRIIWRHAWLEKSKKNRRGHLEAAFHRVVLLDGHQFVPNFGPGRFAFAQQLFSFFHKRIDNVFAGDFAHRHAVFEDHADAAAKSDAEL